MLCVVKSGTVAGVTRNQVITFNFEPPLVIIPETVQAGPVDEGALSEEGARTIQGD